MYDELVKRLREDVPKALSNFDFDYVEDWIKVEGSIKEAADAIEELQKRVPKRPHGRLIDADALPWQKQGLLAADEDWALPCSIIENAPTIIPAEEET